MPSGGLDTVARRDRLVACGGAALLLWLWVMAVGRDLSWDIVNHHIYLPFSLLSGRFETDLFAAGPQSYQNPLGYLPFYALERSPLPSWAIGSLLALMHALAAWPLWRITGELWGAEAGQRWWRRMAMALSWVAPTFLLLAGTSSVDPLTNVLILFALAGVMAPGPSVRSAALCGLLLGLAFAIKPSNAVFALSIGSVLLVRVLMRTATVRSLASFMVAVTVGILLFMGPWSLWLWRAFGNPLFPLFNHWFGSPFAPVEPIAASRFMPSSVLDLLTRPWQLALYKSNTHTEAIAPDLRLLALQVALLAGLVMATWRRLGGTRKATFFGRPDLLLAVFAATSYLLWMATSANSRYAIPMFIIVGVLLVRSVQFVLPERAARIGLGVVLALQVLPYSLNGDHRNGAPMPWSSGPYLEVQVPKRLVESPFLHLSLGTPSHAALAPHLHPEGTLVNAIGVMSLPMEGPLGLALRRRMTLWEGRTRILFVGRPPVGNDKASNEFRARADRFVYRFGLRFDWTDCETIRMLTSRPSTQGAQEQPGGVSLLSCKADPRPDDDPSYWREQAQAERAFAVLEAQCPKVFGPRPMVTNGDMNAWRRHYMNSDARAVVSFTEGVSISHFRSWNLVWLGSFEDVVNGRGKPACKAWTELDVQ